MADAFAGVTGDVIGIGGVDGAAECDGIVVVLGLTDKVCAKLAGEGAEQADKEGDARASGVVTVEEKEASELAAPVEDRLPYPAGLPEAVVRRIGAEHCGRTERRTESRTVLVHRNGAQRWGTPAAQHEQRALRVLTLTHRVRATCIACG